MQSPKLLKKWELLQLIRYARLAAKQTMVPREGIEPPTFGLQNRCSTAELTRLTDTGGIGAAAFLRKPHSNWPKITHTGLQSA